MAFLAVQTVQTVQAATYYVATTGNDNNAGTVAAPFKTIARGSRQLAAGDTLLIRAGTYIENMINGVYGFTFRNGTSKDNMTRFAPAPGDEGKVIVKPPVRAQGQSNFVAFFSRGTHYVEVSGLILDGTNIEFQGSDAFTEIAYAVVKFDGSYDQNLWANNNRLIGNEIRFGGIGVYGGGGSEIIGNKIHHNRVYGVYTSFDNGLLEGNNIHDNAGFGLHLFQQDHQVNGWVVRNNIFARNGDNYYPKNRDQPPYTLGVPSKRPLPGVILSRGSSQFYNNLVYGHPHGGVSIGLGAKDTLVANNTVYGNGDYGISVNSSYSGSLNTRVANNIVWGNSGAQIANTGTNTTLQNNLTTEPGVVNAAAGDFHLRSGSPAINAGVNLYSLGITKDFDGKARPQTGAFERGAFEFGSAPVPVAFNFSLSNGGNKSVTQGASVTNSLTASLVSGTAQAVSLSASGLPIGVTASISPASCTPNCSATLTLSASASAATGTTTVTVTAVGGGVTKTSAFSLTVNAATPPPPPPPATGPVGWWKLDENTGTLAADSSGSNNNGSLTNGPTWTAGRMGSALAFDGVNDSVTIPHSSALDLAGAFSMAAWVNPAASTTNFKSVMVKNYSHFFYASSKGYCGNGVVLAGFVGSGTRNNVCDRNPLPVNAWTHLAATNDGSVLRLYRNGVMTSSAAVTGAPVASTGTLQLGASRYGESFNGKLDDARVYNRALSAAEVLALFNAAAPTGNVTDLNADGITNVTDIQIAVNQAAGSAACATGDINKDGMCNVADVQLVVNKTLGK
jgi:hypothetical protein